MMTAHRPGGVTIGHNADVELAAHITYGALLEAARPDLAALVCYFHNEDGTPYLEPLDEVTAQSLASIVRQAEAHWTECHA